MLRTMIVYHARHIALDPSLAFIPLTECVNTLTWVNLTMTCIGLAEIADGSWPCFGRHLTQIVQTTQITGKPSMSYLHGQE